MIRCVCLTLPLLFGAVVFSSASRLASMNPATQPAVRVAVVGFVPAISNKATNTVLGQALSRDSRVEVIDLSIVSSALAGIHYDGSLNMTKDQARKLGAAIGCDFFIIGKSEAFARSTKEKESHDESYAGVMIVDGRSGALAAFDFFSNNSPIREGALQALLKRLDERVSGYVDRMIQIRTQPRASGSGDSAEDAPGEDSPRSIGFKPPAFLNRARPEYTTEAELADITATVEAMVVFRSNGEVGGIEITRWAGFGLDESSERAIRQLRFNPATRDGVPINVRAMIRYNFRRVAELPKQARSTRVQAVRKTRTRPAPDLQADLSTILVRSQSQRVSTFVQQRVLFERALGTCYSARLNSARLDH